MLRQRAFRPISECLLVYVRLLINNYCSPWWQNGRSISKRGVSCQFGPDVTERFLEQNKLDFIVRSHEVKAEGYEVTHSGKCITVFSAPNYWYVIMMDD